MPVKLQEVSWLVEWSLVASETENETQTMGSLEAQSSVHAQRTLGEQPCLDAQRTLWDQPLLTTVHVGGSGVLGCGHTSIFTNDSSSA